MVAPKYQTYILCGEPYTKGKNQYIEVQHPKTKNCVTARWYSESEYAERFGSTTTATPSKTKAFKGLRQARGFSKGDILVVRGDVDVYETYLGLCKARYAVDTGWYFASTDIDSISPDFPDRLKLIPVSFEDITTDEEHLKPADEIKAAIRKKELAQK